MVKNSDLIIKNVFLGTLSVMILSALTVVLGMLIDGVIIRKCLGRKQWQPTGLPVRCLCCSLPFPVFSVPVRRPYAQGVWEREM